MPLQPGICVFRQFETNPERFNSYEHYTCSVPCRVPKPRTVQACGRVITPMPEEIDGPVVLFGDESSPGCAEALGTAVPTIEVNSKYL